jgi:hypothetical protein
MPVKSEMAKSQPLCELMGNTAALWRPAAALGAAPAYHRSVCVQVAVEMTGARAA